MIDYIGKKIVAFLAEQIVVTSIFNYYDFNNLL